MNVDIMIDFGATMFFFAKAAREEAGVYLQFSDELKARAKAFQLYYDDDGWRE